MRLTRFFSIPCAALAIAATATGHAQDYPIKPISVIVPYAVGGTTDIVARLVTSNVHNTLGQPAVVENRAGGGGLIGWNAAVRAKPDGYTLLTTEMSYTVAPGLIPNLPFNPETGFTQVVTAASAPHVVVINPNVPAHTLQEFIALAKAEPGKFNYGSGGIGTNTHLGAELFKSTAQVDLMHVPYKGAGQVLADLMAGQVQVLVTSLPTALPHIKAGKLRALAVASEQRSQSLPQVPTTQEAGLDGFVMDFWVGFAAPANTPPSVVAQLNQAINAELHSEQGKARLAEQGLVPVGNTPEQASQFVSQEIKRWADVVRKANITIE